jgi:hypothetical protein
VLVGNTFTFLLCSVSPMGKGERSLLDIGHLFVQQLGHFRQRLSTRLRCVATVHIVSTVALVSTSKKGEKT